MVHRPADKMSHVDCLSQNIMYVNSISVEDELLYKQLTDPKIKEIAEMIEIKGSKYFTLIDGIVFRILKEKHLFVVPEQMINNVIRIYHDDMGHVGRDKTIKGIMEHYWFPCLKMKVCQYINNCIKCLSYSMVIEGSRDSMQIVEKDKVPYKTLHLDHFGLLEETVDRFAYILVIVDAFTKFTWLYPTRSTGSEEVINVLESLFSIFGRPEKVISDRGTAFTSHLFA